MYHLTLPLPTTVHDPQTQQALDAIANAFPVSGRNLGVVAPIATVLPANPFVGQQITFKAAEGVYWHLLYTKESAEFPWNKIGGPPLSAEVTTQQETAETVYVNLATVGPELTTPLKGDYDVTIGAAFISNETAGKNSQMSYAIGGTAASDNDAVTWLGTGVFVPQAPASRCRRKTAIASATVLLAKYKGSGGKAFFSGRTIEIDPIRVG